MRKALFITIGLVLVVGGLIFWLDSKKSKVDPWDIISSKALIVIESDNFDALQKAINNKQKLLGGLSDQKYFLKLIDKRKTFFALYKTDANNINGLFIIPNPITGYLDSISQSVKENVKKRNFNGAVIYDIPLKDQSVSYSINENIAVIGPSFLVEDAVRTIKSADGDGFKNQNRNLFQLASLKTDDGNIYFNLYQIGKSRNKVSKIDFARSSASDIKIDEDQIILNGFTIDSVSNSSFLSLFKRQKTIPFSLKEVISQRSLFIEHYSLLNFTDWLTRQERLLVQSDSLTKKNVLEIRKKINWPNFIKSIGSELAMCSFGDQEIKSSIFILKLKDENNLQGLGNVSIDSIYQEEHSGYPIRKVNVPITQNLFWPVVSENDLSYYTLINSYLIFAEDVNSLKDVINDIENDNTLGKSIEWNKFLSSTIQESTVNYYATGNGLLQVLKNLGLNIFDNYLSTVDRVAIQFSSIDNNFYTSATIQLNSNQQLSTPLSAVTGKSSAEFNHPIVISPQIVINHSTKASEILIQDSLNTLHLISKEKILWSLKLEERIKGHIEQIDYLKNKKLQYFFVTENKLHVVDRLGRYVNGFPKTFSGKHFAFSRVVDYDQSKNYRFLVANTGGEIFIYDEKGNELEGWNPKKFGKNVIYADHERILGKDYFFSISEDGQFYLFNRKGEIVNKFPVRTQGKVTGYMINHGKNAQSSYFSLMSEEGLLTQINILGEIIKKEPLLKTSAETHFGVVSTTSRDNYIWRVDKSKFAILDAEGKVIFEKENPASEHLEFNYFSHGQGVFSVFDKSQDLLILLNKKGKELTTQPLEATQIPGVELLPGNKIKVNSVFRNHLNSLVI